MSNEIESKVEFITLSEKAMLQFVYIPVGYKVSKWTLENHKVYKVGLLNSFNKIKLISHWKTKEHNCLVKVFTEQLEKQGWDFNKFPNPTAYMAIYEGR